MDCKYIIENVLKNKVMRIHNKLFKKVNVMEIQLNLMMILLSKIAINFKS